jgi:hypothetical protein
MTVTEWMMTLGLVLTTLVVYAIIMRLARRLSPPLVALRFALSPPQAKRVLTAWTDANLTGRAIAVLLLEAAFLVPLLLITAITLAITSDDPVRPALGYANVIVLFAVLVAGLANYVEIICLLVTTLSRPRTVVVFVTRLLAWAKNTILAFAAVYAIFRAQVYLYVRLGQQEWQYTFAALLVATALVAFIVARRLTAFSATYPPLLALQLAPSRLAAKDVLERWGEKGRRAARHVVLLQSLLAVLYGMMLAGLFERVDVRYEGVQKAAAYLGWFMLIASACHVAQNLGAYVALRLNAMGWWVNVMRRLGWMRMTLLAFAAAYFAGLFLRREWYAVRWLAERIAKLVTT